MSRGLGDVYKRQGLNMERPDLKRMLKAIERRQINLVVTKDYCAIIGLNQKGLENQGILA